MIPHIEQLILEHFRNIPFHNLNLLMGRLGENTIPGGTCSDKTLAFLSDVRDRGANAYLHTAYIGGKEIHRLVRVNVDGRSFYADIGNGWPALRLLPADEAVSFECFGMKYRTEVNNEWLVVFHEKQGRESLQMEINTTPRSEREIFDQINSRYTSGIQYPFSNSLRFSLVVGESFLFLRGNRLEKYSKTGFTVKELDEQDIPKAIQQEFGFDVTSYFPFNN
ncbi:arylamine N-acetyltransferase [Vibrio rhodolitus]|uniref:arylamine N-acetyltransferase n=1 Tax=Vibrio rhodolitus TaxID=2231649 RepID=UPI000E0BE9B0|nr:arylamine N-acetyltransferase [Vibrio rhodolitus]